jgi:hypothetical protein
MLDMTNDRKVGAVDIVRVLVGGKMSTLQWIRIRQRTPFPAQECSFQHGQAATLTPYKSNRIIVYNILRGKYTFNPSLYFTYHRCARFGVVY